MSSPFQPYQRLGRPRHADVLTPAEWDVLAGVRDGLSNRGIAEGRGCDIETVRFHLKNLRRKLGVAGRDELRRFPGRPVEAVQGEAAGGTRHRIREQIPLVHVKDMERSLALYVDVLGFEIVSCWPDGRMLPSWAALGAGAARLMLRVGHPKRDITPARKPGHVTISFYVDGLDRYRRNLIGAGYRCGEPAALFYGAREFYLLDPDGNEIAIVEFAASDPAYLTAPRKARTARRKKP